MQLLECVLPVRAQEGEKKKKNLLGSANYCCVLKATWLEGQSLPPLFQVSCSSHVSEVTTAKILLQTSL